jgi:methanethiol S-methyltransferase
MSGISSRSGAGGAALVWGGASIFAVSLGWFLYRYLVVFGRSVAPGSVALPLLADMALFTLFALHHSLFARTRLKALVEAFVPPHLERSLYTWIASLLFIVTSSLWVPVPGELYRLDGIWAWIGAGTQVAGVVLTFLSARAVDALDLAGVRAFLLRHHGQPPRHTPLNTGGVFGLVRHPLYFGWTLFVFGAPHMTATRAAFAVVSTAYIALAIPWEERSLIATFGADYVAYRRAVRWRMVPGVY